ncbi:MAG: SpoIIE family protein phosphatase [Planctomycetota bacterium JB042]
MGWFGRGKNDKRERTSLRRSPGIGDPTQVLTGDDRIDSQKVRILLDTIAELISTVDHKEVLTSIVDNAIGVVKAERGILFLFEDGDPEQPRIQVARDHRGVDLRSPIQYSTTVVRDVCRTGESKTWKVSSSQSEAVDLSQSIVDMKLTSVMCTTLRVKERRLGVIYVDSRATQREFDRGDLRFFDALAGALAVAVENARLIREILATERVKEQVKIARTIQEGLLPNDPASIEGFDLAGWSLPAEEALGDYYDFIPLRDGRWIVAIGDVAGHGIGPALLMSSARSMLHSLTDGPFDLSDVLDRMNKRFEADTDGGIFMSLFVAVLDPREKSFVYANAGQNAPALLKREGGKAIELERTGVALGIDGGGGYEVKGPITFAPGEMLLLATDGILEARRGDDFFGKDRLQEAARKHGERPAKECIRAVHEAVLEYTGGEPPDDDLTLVVVRAL